eukprot:10901412-Ditylum_brightwellii.AAC.1
MTDLTEMNSQLTNQEDGLTNKLNTKDQSTAELTTKFAGRTAAIEQLAKNRTHHQQQRTRESNT